jgi:lathosterol oxidase
MRLRVAKAIDLAVLLGLGLSGLLHPESPRTWFVCLAVGFAGIALPVVAGAGLVTLLSSLSQRRVQGPRRLPALMLRGARDTAGAAFVAACFLAWPLAQWRLHHPIGLVWTLREAGGSWGWLIVQTVGALLVMDAWLYWKHRLLHTRLLFPFHREHHAFGDPTAFASFAVGPVESLLTFWPIILLAIPAATHFAPVYFGLVGGFILLNFYLHCGVAVGLIEGTLPRLFVNTSVFHNAHHANAQVNFGEALTLWDHLCRTRVVDAVKDPADRLPARAR